MVAELQFLLSFMISAKKIGHSIYEIQRNSEYVQNVFTLASLYRNPSQEMLAIATRADSTALGKFTVNHPYLDLFPKKKKEKSSLIHFLCASGDVKGVKLLLSTRESKEEKTEMLTFPGDDGNTPYMLAKRGNHGDLMKFLEKHGAKIEGRGGWEPIHIACKKGNIEHVRKLLANCATEEEKTELVNLRTDDGFNSVLCVVGFFGSTKTLRVLDGCERFGCPLPNKGEGVWDFALRM